MSKERMSACKKAATSLSDQMKSQGIAIASCGVRWLDDGSDYFIELTLHISEENKNHALPDSYQGFLVRCEYGEYAQFA